MGKSNLTINFIGDFVPLVFIMRSKLPLKKSMLIGIMLSFQFIHIYSQPGKEAWNWCFSDSVKLDFSSGMPVEGTCAWLKQYYSPATACISDKNSGQLLFYTDGYQVWDKNNLTMPNGTGLLGNTGGGHHVIIIPKPGSSNLYFIMQISGWPSQGLYYNIVDMNLNGGLGDVDVTPKNVLLDPRQMSNVIAGVKHCNGVDYWLITHSFSGNTFYCYQVSASGISSPVITNIGANQTGGSINDIKISSNGKKIAAPSSLGLLEIFNFNNNTGKLSNLINIPFPTPNSVSGVGDVSFSPNSEILYTEYRWITTIPGVQSHSALYQFQVNDSSNVMIPSKTTIVSDIVGGDLGGMQIGPDNKIYIGTRNVRSLSIISNPNNFGNSCNFQLNALLLDTTAAYYNGGFPNFIDANYDFSNSAPNVYNLENGVCSANNFSITAENGSGYLWSNGDISQSTTINTPDKYWVSFINADGCKQVDTFLVKIIPSQMINNIKNSGYCDDNLPVKVNATRDSVISYVWNDGGTGPIHDFYKSGNYWVEYNLKNNCVVIDSFELAIRHILTTDSFPNIVTPNEDGLNDYIDFGKYNFATLSIKIFNRWGELIFESENPSSVWSPKTVDGTYFITLNYTMDCGSSGNKKFNLASYITVVR